MKYWGKFEGRNSVPAHFPLRKARGIWQTFRPLDTFIFNIYKISVRIAFSWTDANIGHIGKHDVAPEEAEEVVRAALPPFPRDLGDGKSMVWAQTTAGRYLQVIYVFPAEDEIDPTSMRLDELIAFSEGEIEVVTVIHAMEMTADQKKRFRRETRKQR